MIEARNDTEGELVGAHRILDGGLVFKLVDSKGLPLGVISEMLRADGLGFNVVQFIEAALASKNFTYGTIKQRLLYNYVGDKEKHSQRLDALARKKGWLV